MQNDSAKQETLPTTKEKNFSLFALTVSLRRGFTLLETVIALAVIMAAVVGPVSLITRGLLDFSFAKNKIIAVNLAQEGIELIRAVRENNIICDSLNGNASWAWNRDPEGGSLANTKRRVSVGDAVNIDCTPPGGGPSQIIVTPRLPLATGETLRFDASTGLYGYIGQNTAFTREVTICVPPNAGGDCSGTPDGDIPAADQMDVISRVTWTERGTAREVTLRDRMYRWK